MRHAYALPLGTLLMLAGCTSISGLSGDNEFGCKAPPGVTCQSISGVHANAMAENLPFQRQSETVATVDGDKRLPRYGDQPGAGKVSPKEMQAPMSGMPIRKPPLILRVWVAPYEDDANDLHDQSYFYTMVHPGEWMIEANRSHLRNQFRPVMAPMGGTAAPDQESVPARVRSAQPSTYAQPIQSTD